MRACVCVHSCAKSLQLCRTLCDPMGCSLPGSSVHRIYFMVSKYIYTVVMCSKVVLLMGLIIRNFEGHCSGVIVRSWGARMLCYLQKCNKI